MQIPSDDLFPQGSEIFTVLAKDGDVGNPNPIHYSFEEGKHFTQRHSIIFLHAFACFADMLICCLAR